MSASMLVRSHSGSSFSVNLPREAQPTKQVDAAAALSSPSPESITSDEELEKAMSQISEDDICLLLHAAAAKNSSSSSDVNGSVKDSSGGNSSGNAADELVN